jgi:hypothetical protein
MLVWLGLFLLAVWLLGMGALRPVLGDLVHVPLLFGILLSLIGFLRGRDAAGARVVGRGTDKS